MPISTWRYGGGTSPSRSAPTNYAPCSRTSPARLISSSLPNQPLTWDGATNPFALLPHQRAASYGFSGALVPDFEALLRSRTNAETRKKMRKKERALASSGELHFERAIEPDDVRRVLDAFFKQKSARMRALGTPDAFAFPGVRRFVEAAAIEPLRDGKPLIELYALSVDDIIVATMGGIVGGGRFCAMFNSIIQGRFAVESPGEQLILKLVRNCCERGLVTFDLGVGEARYKNLLCGDTEPLFDNYLPLSAAGRLFAFTFATGAAAKRTIKQRHALWALVRAHAAHARKVFCFAVTHGRLSRNRLRSARNHCHITKSGL